MDLSSTELACGAYRVLSLTALDPLRHGFYLVPLEREDGCACVAAFGMQDWILPKVRAALTAVPPGSSQLSLSSHPEAGLSVILTAFDYAFMLAGAIWEAALSQARLSEQRLAGDEQLRSEVSRLLARIAAARGIEWHAGSIAGHTGVILWNVRTRLQANRMHRLLIQAFPDAAFTMQIDLSEPHRIGEASGLKGWGVLAAWPAESRA